MKRIVLSVCAALAAVVVAWGRTATWQPDGDGNWSGDWKSTEHWSTGAEPTAADDVVLPTEGATASYTVTAGAKIRAKSLTVGSGAGNGFTATFESQTWDLHEVAGDLVVKGDGTMTHKANTTTSVTPAENTLFKLRFSVSGNATIAGGAVLDASGKGYPASNLGPGKGVQNSYGGSHGGRAYPYGGTPSPCYDSIECPVMLGSSGRSAGGGVIRLEVAGSLTLNGRISANGAGCDTYYTGSGGSVWISAATVSGGGTVETDGGITGHGSYPQLGGGGGRIAITTASDSGFAGWTGNAHAYGGYLVGTTAPAGAYAGTVYQKEGTQQGVVTVDNNGGAIRGTEAYGADWTSGQYDSDEFLRSVKLVVTNGGCVKVVADAPVGDVAIEKDGILTISECALSVNGSFLNGGTLRQSAASRVALTGSSEATVSGSSVFSHFSCTVPSKTIRFATGSGNLFGIAAGGSLTLRGAENGLLALRGVPAGETWRANVAATAEVDLEYLDVEWSDATAGAVLTAWRSSGGEAERHNAGWSFPRDRILGETNTWMGVSAFWQDLSNWSLERLPAQTDAIRIPSGAEHMPTLDADGAFERLIVAADATFSLNGFDLSVSNNLEVAGLLAVSGGETISVGGDLRLTAANDLAAANLILVGDVAQAVSPAGISFSTIRVLKTGGGIAFDDGFTARHLLFEPSAAMAATFAPEKTVVVNAELILDGSRGGLTLASSGAMPWRLQATAYHQVMNVSVSKCDASEGAKICAVSSSDGGGNENWSFDVPSSVWTGAVSQDFRTAENWYPAGVPGPTSRVVVAAQPGQAISVSIAAGEPVSIADLAVFAPDMSATLTSKTRLTVGGGVFIGPGGKLALDYCGADGPNVVSNDFEIADGGVLTHSKNGITAAGVVSRLCLEVKGNMRVQDGGAVDVSACGFTDGGNIGGTHGGIGGAYNGNADWITYCPSYGSVESPVTVGRAARDTAGGGAVRLVVGQTLFLDGTISACGGGVAPKIEYSGAGGSVWITAGAISGAGLITACGGDNVSASYSMGGGGGRVSLAVGANGFADWSGRTLAFGGRNLNGLVGGFAGTICTREGNGLPYVLVDNDGGHVVVGGWNHPIGTLWPTEDTEEFLRSAQVTIRNGGHVTISEDTCVGEISLEDGGYLTVTNVTLKINSTVHRKRRKWTGTVQDANGTIIWPSGMLLIIK